MSFVLVSRAHSFESCETLRCQRRRMRVAGPMVAYFVTCGAHDYPPVTVMVSSAQTIETSLRSVD
eukprot:scaffold193635_cov30-Tisochrysis_lutea.AAC.5